MAQRDLHDVVSRTLLAPRPYLGPQGCDRQDQGLFRGGCCLKGGEVEDGRGQAGGRLLHGSVQRLVIGELHLLHEGAGASDQGSA